MDEIKKHKLQVMKLNIDYVAAKTYLDGLVNSFGDKLLTNLQIMRTLAFTNCCAKPMTPSECKAQNLPNGSHWASSNFLQLYYKDYIKLLDLIEGNELISFGHKEYVNSHTGEATYSQVRVAVVNPKYIKECEIELNESDYKHMIINPRKTSKLGKLHSYNKNIKIDISKDLFEELVTKHLMMKHPEKTQEELQADLDSQWRVISKINSTGSIQPHMTIKGRCSSRITQISHPCNDFILIEGEETIELDQHATYLTLLPEVLNTRVSDKSDEFVKELSELRLLIKNTPNLYVHISNCIGVDMLEIKKEVNKFFCDPKASRTYKYKFFEFFNSYFPELSKSINYLRCKKGPYSDFNRLESFIFSGSAKELLNLGIPAITKYDSLIIRIKDLDIAKKILNERFIKARVSNKTKESKKIKDLKILKENKNLREFVGEIEFGDIDKATGAAGAPIGAEVAEEDALPPDFQSSPTKPKSSPTKWTVARKSTVKQLKDGRYTISIKNKQYNSKKNETLEEFKIRIYNLTGLKV